MGSFNVYPPAFAQVMASQLSPQQPSSLPTKSVFDPPAIVHPRATPPGLHYDPKTNKTKHVVAPNGFSASTHRDEIPHNDHLVEPMVHRMRGEVLKPTPHMPPCKNDAGKVSAAKKLGQSGCPVIPLSTNVPTSAVKRRVEFYGEEHTRGCEFFPSAIGMLASEDTTTPITRVEAGGARPYERYDLRPE